MPPRWTDDELVAFLRATADHIDGPLTVPAYNRHRPTGAPVASTISGALGPWHTALDRAGLPPTGHRIHRPWTRDEALEAIAGWLSTTDDPARLTYERAARRTIDLPTIEQVIRLFATWTKARALAEQPSGSS